MCSRLTALFLTATLAAASPQSLQARQDFCGTDIYGIDWYCTEVGTECCNGSVQGTCIPTGYTCCDTGLYCSPDEECVIDLSTNTQYCVSMDDSEETHVADSESASSTGSSSPDDEEDEESGSSSNSDDDETDRDRDEDGGAARGGVSGAGVALVGLVAVGMALL